MNAVEYRRAPGIRAFADKSGGWTLVTPGGEPLSLRNSASLCLWESLARGASVDALTERLRQRHPEAPATRIRADILRFLRDLEVHGFVEIRTVPSAAVSDLGAAD